MVGCLLVSLDFFSVCLLYPLMKLRIISESETMKPLEKYNKFTHCCQCVAVANALSVFKIHEHALVVQRADIEFDQIDFRYEKHEFFSLMGGKH